MRTLIILLLVLAINCSFGQSRSLLNKLARDLAEQLKDGRIRGKTERLTFFKDSTGIKIVQTGLDSRKRKLEKIITGYADSLQATWYNATLYFDEYSDHIYPFVHRQTIFKGFPNFDDYHANPKITKNRLGFIELIYKDLRKHQSDIDTLSYQHWVKPIEILVEPTGEHTLINETALTKLLDSSLAVKWQPGLYHGELIRSLVSIRVKRHVVLSQNEVSNYLKYFDDVTIDQALQEKYKDKFVRYKIGQTKPIGNPLVSFVFNPISERLENPIIHNGDIEEVQGLIDWLQELQLPSHVFYWSIFPEAKRTYFYMAWW